MTEFQQFSKLVHTRYLELAKGELFTTIDGDELYSEYIKAFPEGSNPIYLTKTEHECSCCKNFIRNLGNVVGFIDGKLTSIWEVQGAPYPYGEVTIWMNNMVTLRPITSLFRSKEPQYGAEVTRSMLADGSVKRWNHFHGRVQQKHLTATPAEAQGSYATTVQVFRRGLNELDQQALQTVIELIDSKALYRGEEHLPSLKAFREVQTAYFTLSPAEREEYVWTQAGSPAARFRNTVIGSLIVDLSEGVDLERAVASFEAKVAPTNYKRPTALITPRMVQDALATITTLGLDSALDRRFAAISDVTINNVLWADNSAKNLMKGHLENLLMGAVTSKPVTDDKAEDISIEDFMRTILPAASSIDMLVQNSHAGNFMSLTAPKHSDSGKLFKWGNDFAWSYEGNITDSIKDRVKKAGGSVTGDVCCRLAWEYKDDLDFHMQEPDGNHIDFRSRRHVSRCGGVLDLDANGADGQRDDPAENIVYADKSRMKAGNYKLLVNNYSRRSSDGKGFVVEIEVGGVIHSFVYDKTLRTSETVEVACIVVGKDGTVTVVPMLPSSAVSKTVWNLQTQTYVRVQTLMHSPNYWDDNAVGNKHWFFMLEGCKNAEPARGIYNEFLSSNLEKHRKVFEILGERTKCEPTDDQLSGLGFSSTKRDAVTVKVKGVKLQKTFNITF